MFEFKVTGKLKNFGRTGIFTTPHGDIKTPVFMPVGTAATVKAVPVEFLNQINAQIILSNNYHLFLRPGHELIKNLGGLHRFMNWSRPILTDSGGFQVWSLGQSKTGLAKIDSAGVEFKSHLDGSLHFFTPELATRSQINIGADIIMAFDQCTSDTADKESARQALHLTHHWLDQCLTEYDRAGRVSSSTKLPQSLFGIIQGAMHEDLRQEAAQFVVNKNLDGIAIGGETIGYNMAGTATVLDWIRPYLPENKPRYTMGLGLKPSDLLAAISLGVDMFDCVAPTRLARNGALYTGRVILDHDHYHFESESETERINIGNSRFTNDTSPIDPYCDCLTCHHYTRAYLHHLYLTKELLYYTLASVHNLRMMTKTVEDAVNLRD